MTRATNAVLVLFLLAATPLFAQSGIPVDQRDSVSISQIYVVKSVEVTGRLRDQVAEIQVHQTFHNPGRGLLEAEFLFPLPEDGAIQNMVLLADGKELPGRIMNADEARAIYESIVRSKKDPALLQFVGRGLLKTSVFPIPPGEDRTVTLRYTRLCKMDRERVEFSYPISTHGCTAQPVGRFTLDLTIESAQPIKSIYSPAHNPTIQRQGANRASIHLEQSGLLPTDDFRLFYAVDPGSVGTTMLSYMPREGEDGYFMLLASPGFAKPDSKPIQKSVLFVLDKSGSMSGVKIEQAKAALRFVVHNLREGDSFNIVAYDDQVELFHPEPKYYDPESRDAALAFVDNIRAGGGTDINAALTGALAMAKDKTRPTYILFLTDGLPSAGEQDELKIAQNAESANAVGARIIGFGVGHDVNARLIDRITSGNGGVSEYVAPNEDVEASVARLYGRIASPVLAAIELSIDGTPVNRAYPRSLPDIFEGGQLVYVGRYKKPGDATVVLTGKVGGESVSFTHSVTFASAGAGSGYAFVERIWAMRRIGHLIDQIDLNGRSDELINELVELSQRHGILTPYTAFLADETVQLVDERDNRVRAKGFTDRLQEVRGESANSQRASKQGFIQSENLSSTLPAQGLLALDESAEGKLLADRRLNNVLRVGDKSFYRKGEFWIESTLTEADAEKATNIKQLSDEHMALNRVLQLDDRPYVAMQDNVIVKLEGKVYRIER